jgi:hypothetical protein
MLVRDVLVRGRRLTASVEYASRSTRHEGKRALLEDVPGTSNIKSKPVEAVPRGGKLCESCLLCPERFLRVCEGHL